MNFRNSDCATVRVNYIRCSPHGDVDSAVCGKRAVSNFETVFGRIKSFNCVDLHLRMLTGKFLHEGFASPKEVVSLSQQERTAPVQRACEVFSIK